MSARRLISHDSLAAKCISYSKTHLWRLEKAGKFPKRVPVGPGRYAYVESEVDDYIERMIAERDAPKSPKPPRKKVTPAAGAEA